MMFVTENPFEVTKAVDYTDEEIDQTWVKLPGARGDAWPISGSLMPIFLVGAKGGGRTHLLRHISFPLQRFRANRQSLPSIELVRKAGYLGIYLRCGGLNSSRFSGKGVDDERWATVFAYYTDVWLASLCLDTLCELLPDSESEHFVREASKILNPPIGMMSNTLAALREGLRAELRAMDVAINNVALSGELPIVIRANPGRLVFELPTLVVSEFAELTGITFYYLVDEFENLTESQQVYINTLIRERDGCSTFIVGSRKFGVRTHRTLSGEEENRPGSEFDEIVLEDDYRSNPSGYGKFCANLTRARLAAARLAAPADLHALFVEHQATDRLWSEKVLDILDGRCGADRPWLRQLQVKLLQTGMSRDDARTAARELRFDDAPLLEKFAILQFFRDWHRLKGPSVAAATRARSLALSVRAESDRRAVLSFEHYREDLYSQTRHALQREADYFGFDSIVRMSGYLPRNYLLALKKIYKWASFEGLPQGSAGPLSLSAQRQGILEAAEWFLSDSKALGASGEDAQLIVRRLGSFLRDLRFTDKPTEVSASTIAFNRRILSPTARRTLDTCVRHSQLIEIPLGHRTKNRETLMFKYQLNPMLAPLFDLPITRRGVVQLTDAEASVLLDPEAPDGALRSIHSTRLRAMNAPFGSGSGSAQLW